MNLIKSIFSVFLTVAFATTGAFAGYNCDNIEYRYTHPTKCNSQSTIGNRTLLTLAGGAALVGVGVALASQTSGDHGSSSAITNQNSFQRIALSSNIDANYAQSDIVNNRRIATVSYQSQTTNGSDIADSTINAIKNTAEYNRNHKQYDAINFAYANARGFSGKNTNIVILDDFHANHGDTVHEIAQNIANGANITDMGLTTSENKFASFDYIANVVATNTSANVYNASWQMVSTPDNNAATAIYNGNSAKTYADAQSYMYNLTSENFVNQIRNSAIDNDAIFVWAAGNDSQNESGALSAMPLAFPELNGHFVNVVAIDNYGQIAWFSNQCGVTQNYCIAAPGSGWNTDIKDFASGTSFAAPVVSGAIATIREAFPYMSANEITQLLFTTATDLGESGVDSVYGWGLLNMDRATQPVGNPRIVLSNDNIVPLNNINVSGPIAGAIKNSNVKIAFVDDFGRAFKTNLSDNINVIPRGRGFDKLRENDNDSVVLFDTFEFGFHENNLLESYGLMSSKSNKLTNFIGYKNEFNIDNVRFYQNARFGITNPSADTDNSIISGFSNIYTASAKIGTQYNDWALEIAIPDVIISGDMYMNIPVARTNNGQMVYSNIGLDLSTRPSVEYTMKYKHLSATYVVNPSYENEFFIMAKTTLAF